jgi:hypothetical protein
VYIFRVLGVHVNSLDLEQGETVCMRRISEDKNTGAMDKLDFLMRLIPVTHRVTEHYTH